MYGIYVDYLFILNFSLDLFLLLAVKWTWGRTATRLRLVLSAAAAAAGYCLFLLGTGKKLWGFCLLSAGMLIGAFGYGDRKLFLDSLLTLYGYSCLLGGVLLFCRQKMPGLFQHYALPGSILAALAAGAAVRRLCLRLRRQKKSTCLVILEHQGEQWKLQGFWDTGNGLRDPVWGKPVNVLDAGYSRKLQARLSPCQLVVIPYHTVGRQAGVMYGARVEKLWIEQEGKRHCVQDALVAFSEREFAAQESFQILLQPGILE